MSHCPLSSNILETTYKIICIQLQIWKRKKLYRVNTNMFIGDLTERWLPCLVGDFWSGDGNDIPYRRPTCLIGDWHASSETDMPHQRTACLIRNRHVLLRSTCLIADWHVLSETDMSHQRPNWLGMLVSLVSPLRHFVSRFSPMSHVSLRFVISISHGSPIRYSGLS